MFNSKDNSYYFFSKNYSKDWTGNIVDTKNNFFHSFKITNSKIDLKFNYSDSQKRKNVEVPCNDKGNYFEINENKIDSLKTDFKVIRYSNANKKTILLDSSIKAIKEDMPLFEFFMKKFYYHFVYCEKLTLPTNFLPLEVIIDYHNGNIISTVLKEKKDINVTLEIEEINIKE